eukprot:6714467-Pyramimonas_sp.AAC.1
MQGEPFLKVPSSALAARTRLDLFRYRAALPPIRLAVRGARDGGAKRRLSFNDHGLASSHRALRVAQGP